MFLNDVLRFDLQWWCALVEWSICVGLSCRPLGPLASHLDPASGGRPLPLHSLGLAPRILEEELAPGIHAVLVMVNEGRHVVLQL